MSDKFQITAGDTQKPLGRTLKYGNGIPVDVSSLTVKFEMYPSSGGDAVIEATTTGITKHPTFNFTVDTDENWIKCNDHVAQDGDQIVVSTTTTLPAGLAASTRYFVKERTPNTFKLSLTPEGPTVAITDAGSGTQSFYIVGSVQFAWPEDSTNDAGSYEAWFQTVDGDGKVLRFPNSDVGIPVEIKEVP